MSIGRHLLHTCDVHRATESNTVTRAKKRTFSLHSQCRPCRLVTRTKAGLNALDASFYTFSTYTLLAAYTEDIQEGDRVTGFTFEDGTQDTTTYDVKSVIKPRGHSQRLTKCMLEKVR